MVTATSFAEFKVWLSEQPASVHGLVLKLAADGRCFSDFANWIKDFRTEYDATDWSCYQSSFDTVEVIQWRAKALADLAEWMKISQDYSRTVKAWAAVYIQCGICADGFFAWYENCDMGPEDDLQIWLTEATKVVTDNHWV